MVRDDFRHTDSMVSNDRRLVVPGHGDRQDGEPIDTARQQARGLAELVPGETVRVNSVRAESGCSPGLPGPEIPVELP